MDRRGITGSPTRAPAGSVAVIGAGITGLACAEALLRTPPGAPPVVVTVYEADARVGGRLAASAFAGVAAIDESADAFLARVPDAVDLAVTVGLELDLTHPEPVGAAVWNDGLHDLPDGLLLGVPGRLLPMARSSLLSPRAKVRAALEPLLPRTSLSSDSVGALIRARFGDEVHERLVDALVGSIYATDTDRFSLAEVPQLHGLASAHRSLLLGARRQRAHTGTATDGAVFAAPRGGVGALAHAVATTVTEAGGDVRLGAAVGELAPRSSHPGSRADAPHGWTVDGERFDAVVLATPATAAAPLLGTPAPAAADLLGRAETADVILVTLHVDADEWPDRLAGRSGYLVPKPAQRWVTAASFGSQKWAHWRPPAGGEILRVSLGRDGQPVLHLSDDEVLDHVLSDLERHLGVAFAPREVRISRWPGAFAQYRPHHAAWADAVDAALPAGLFVAGASYRGIGIPACVRQGRTIAERTRAFVERLAD